MPDVWVVEYNYFPRIAGESGFREMESIWSTEDKAIERKDFLADREKEWGSLSFYSVEKYTLDSIEIGADE